MVGCLFSNVQHMFSLPHVVQWQCIRQGSSTLSDFFSLERKCAQVKKRMSAYFTLPTLHPSSWRYQLELRESCEEHKSKIQSQATRVNMRLEQKTSWNTRWNQTTSLERTELSSVSVSTQLSHGTASATKTTRPSESLPCLLLCFLQSFFLFLSFSIMIC